MDVKFVMVLRNKLIVYETTEKKDAREVGTVLDYRISGLTPSSTGTGIGTRHHCLSNAVVSRSHGEAEGSET